ncbi:MAG TPA: NAD(P)H-dependent oxidoreductase [Candidatus Saccharimonadales bacterium]|nr:NAD(P)H-dependent oxidoreductase [Candidatus Saccharimonadales bacterium]
MNNIDIIALSGSLREGSYTTKLVRAFAAIAPAGISIELVDISQLPLINEDLETDLPEPVRMLRGRVRRADAVLLATPEYNRSYSPVVKNALDWASRPSDQSCWNGKPAAIVGCTPYTLGAFGAQHHLRQVLTYLNMPTLQQPEFYLSLIAEKMDDQGVITDPDTREHIKKFLQAFIAWIHLINATK